MQASVSAENKTTSSGVRRSAVTSSMSCESSCPGAHLRTDEDKTLGTHAVIVSGRPWQRRFASDPNIVGKTIDLNNRALSVIGVAPETFKGTKFALSLDFWCR